MAARDIDGATPEADGASSLAEVMAELELLGYTEQFIATPDGVRCGSCDTTIDPDRLANVEVRRLEGASDPADNLLVVAATCPTCDAKGSMTLQYGPTAGEADQAVLEAIDL